MSLLLAYPMSYDRGSKPGKMDEERAKGEKYLLPRRVNIHGVAIMGTMLGEVLRTKTDGF